MKPTNCLRGDAHGTRWRRGRRIATLAGGFFAALAAGAGTPATLRIQNEHLTVTVDPESALLLVEDRRSGRVYRQFHPDATATFRVIPRTKAGDVTTAVREQTIVAVVAGPIEAVWTIAFGPHAGDLISTLSAKPETPLAAEIAFPAPFEVEPGRDWHLINRREGVILKVEDPVFFESLRRPIRQNEWGDNWGADDSMQMMNWFGTTDLKSGLAVVNKTGYDARLSMRLLGRPRRFVCSFAWKPSLETFRYDRILLYHFSPAGGYLPLAKRVRQYHREETPWITLRQKREMLPQLDRMIGAVDIWVWRDTPYRMEEMKAADRSALPADPLNSPEFIRELHAAGIRKALLGFSVGRNDSPTYRFPTTPEDARVSRELLAEADRLGYLPLVYDNYTVPDERWGAATVQRVTLYNKDGTPYQAPNGKTNVFYPAIMDLARREVGEHLTAYPMKARFFDTLPARPLVEAYQPGRPPVDRAEFGRGKADFATMCSQQFGLVLGGENISAFMIPHLHYNEGIMTMSGFTGRSESANKGYIDWPIDPMYTAYGINEYHRLPLFELVFHDCIVSTWHWRTENHKNEQLWRQHDLFNILYGTMPLWNLKPGLWRDYRERFVRSYRDVCESVFSQVGYDELVEHRWLTSDRKVQESVFSSGLRVIVNFGDTPYRTPSGDIIAAQSFSTGEKR